MNEYSYGVAPFLNKRHGHSALDRSENKSALANAYNFTKHSSKLARFDRLNSSHVVTGGGSDDKGIIPLRSDSIKTELHREPTLEGVKRSGRLKTDESDKLRKIDMSFDCVYLEKQKALQEQKKKIVPVMQNTRAVSNNRGGRNITTKEYLNISKAADENVIEPLRKKIYPRLQNKRTSAQVEKSFTSGLDTTLPAIYINGVERYRKEKSSNGRAGGDRSEYQTIDSPSTANPKRERIASKLIQPMSRVPGPRPEAANGSRSRVKNESSSSPNHENTRENYSFTQNLRSTSSLAGNNAGFSPPRDKDQNLMNHSFLEGMSSSMNGKSHLRNPLSIDHAFERVNELTNKNNLARYDLLKIQESALELKMRLNARRTQLGRPMKEMNRANQTVIEELNSYKSLFVMDGET